MFLGYLETLCPILLKVLRHVLICSSLALKFFLRMALKLFFNPTPNPKYLLNCTPGQASLSAPNGFVELCRPWRLVFDLASHLTSHFITSAGWPICSVKASRSCSLRFGMFRYLAWAVDRNNSGQNSPKLCWREVFTLQMGHPVEASSLTNLITRIIPYLIS